MIGVTVARRQSSAYKDYLQRLRDAGADPLELEPGCGKAEDVIGPLSGLLLPGGGDVQPACYAAEAHPETSGTRPELDALEIEMVCAAQARRIPVLAICRGHQLLNVALGGSLHQHIDGNGHRALTGEPSRWHDVRIEPRSRLASHVGSGVQRVNSRHHQAVLPQTLAPRLRAVAVSPDGLVEASESEDGAWTVSVQWHPERIEMWARSRALFEAFVHAAGATTKH
jgi:putative glutamine amidotransferase